MRNPLYALWLALLCAGSFAQEMPRNAPATRDPNANSHAPKTWVACLRNENGKVTFDGKSGEKYQAVSDRASLSAYVGKKVRITGYFINPEDSSNTEMSNTAGVTGIPPQVHISEIEKIADGCPAKK
ncbi:MAG TPA: hypothetical protein VFA74_15815 [Terriglobales bacterium]|nr:hypothetical protein [Terriglobales bacterium]